MPLLPVYADPPAPGHPSNPQANGSTGRDSSGKRIYGPILAGIISCFAAFVGVFLFLMFCGSWVIYVYQPQFEVESASVSQLNTNGSSLTASWDISLLATNPNREYFKIYVDSVQSEVQYQYMIGDQVVRLGSTQLPPFALEVRENKPLNFKVEAVEQRIGDAVAQEVSTDMSRGSVRFAVKLPIAVRYEAATNTTLLMTSNSYEHEVVCRDLDFKFPGNNGTGVLASQSPCSII